MAVTYMRPFTTSSLLTLTEYEPTAGRDRELHAYLADLRDKVHAHTDSEAERRVSFGVGNEAATETDWVPYAEQYMAFPAPLVPEVVALCGRLRDKMLQDARTAWIELERPQGDWF